IQSSHKKRRSKKQIQEFRNKVSKQIQRQSLSSETDHEWEDNDLECDTRYNAFLPEHPLYFTHEVTCNIENLSNIVPNFLGGSLPRADQGDREYYCMTMLTLFKPWRDGFSLKDTKESWDDAFVSYNFNEQDKKIMSYFNLRYECLDAQDDFHSELKRKSKKASNFNSNTMDSDSSESEDDDDYTNETKGKKIVDYNDLKENARRRMLQQEEISKILRDSGWTDDCSLNNHINNLNRYIPTFNLSANAWKNKVKE
ncbi:hypothetical protein GALMADRAFT_49966, partial [Galerina marginata CBS 339.88]